LAAHESAASTRSSIMAEKGRVYSSQLCMGLKGTKTRFKRFWKQK
jgi:hypothetical protein